MNDKEKEDLIRQYCDNKMKQLRKICDPIIRLMNVPLSEYDDLYSDAMKVVLESVEEAENYIVHSTHFLLVTSSVRFKIGCEINIVGKGVTLKLMNVVI